MAEITASLVKELREKSGAGMMDAKKALVESGGDMEAAVDWLRAKGLSKAAKKSGRMAAEGLVAVTVSRDGTTGAAVELNAETDFVARNATFQEALAGISRVALDTDGTLEGLKAAPSPDGQGTVDDLITRLIATIGENMTLRRIETVSVGSGAVASYVHNAAAEGMGKVGVLVALEGEGADLAEAGRKVAMHVAATSPAAATIESLDPALVERERTILTDQARESGKPDAVIEKMIDGRMRKFYQEVVLVEQAFVMDPDKTVGKVIEEAGATLRGFVHFKLGEGLDKGEGDDFAAEVAAITKG